MGFVVARRGGSLKRLHRPNLLEFDFTGFKDKTRFSIICRVSTLFALNAGLMKPRRGSAPSWAKEKTRGGQAIKHSKNWKKWKPGIELFILETRKEIIF